MISKGKSDCHVSNDKYREGWERVFGEKEAKISKARAWVEDGELVIETSYDMPMREEADE